MTKTTRIDRFFLRVDRCSDAVLAYGLAGFVVSIWTAFALFAVVAWRALS